MWIKPKNNPWEEYPSLIGAKIWVSNQPTETPSWNACFQLFRDNNCKAGDTIENGFMRLELTQDMGYKTSDGKPHTTDNHDRQAGIAEIVTQHYGV